MYSDFVNQFVHLAHYAFAFVLLFIIIPVFLFKREHSDLLTSIWSKYIRIVFFYIVFGYLLVALKLFEFITFSLVLIIVLFRKYLFSFRGMKILFSINIHLYNYFDGKLQVKKSLNNWLITKIFSINLSLLVPRKPQDYLHFILLIIVFSYSIYLRYYDAVNNAAPSFADGYVTIAWMKYIDQRILFHDGIYPQGLYMYMGIIQKFAQIDQLYIAKYTGPLNGVFIVAGLYFTVSRLTGNRFAGLIAAIIYGVLGEYYMGSFWDRQAGTNSQEFAFVFVFPSLFFLIKYMKEGKKVDGFTALSGAAIIGMVHSLAYSYLALAAGILGITFILQRYNNYWYKLWKIVKVGVGSLIIASIPLSVGLLIGRQFHSTSAEYLVSIDDSISKPILSFLDLLTISSLIGIFCIYIVKRFSNSTYIVLVFTILFGVTLFGIYYLGGSLTGSVLIATRSGDLWALTVPFSIGIGWFAFGRLFRKYRLRNYIDFGLCLTILVLTIFYLKPSPIVPYKLEWNSGVEQYLKISSMYRPKTWMIVSQEEGYSLTLGKGFHMYIGDFINMYDPDKEPLTKIGEQSPDRNIPPNVFIYREKEIFKVDKNNAIYVLLEPQYERREREKEELEKWIARYQSTHKYMEIFYEDDQLQIIQLVRKEEREEMNKILWGNGGE